MKPADTDTRRVLVMDDEDQLRRVVGRMLQFLGHEVTTTADGSEAIAAYQSALAANEPFDVLILDLTVLGGIGGQEALASILALDPTAKAIASSGYSGDDVIDNFAQYGFVGALEKPYRIQQLRDKIESVMATAQ